MNKVVSFEIGLLVKEKGFDVKTIYVFTEWGDKYKAKLVRQESQRKNHLSAPTIAEMVMWLYEKHDIWISVEININSMWYYTLSNLKDKRNAEINTELEEYYNSPSEAYTEAITYVLNNLI